MVEQGAILGFIDSPEVATDEFHSQFSESPTVSQIASDIEGRLPTHSSEQGIGFLNLKDALDDIGEKGFDIDAVGHFGVVLNGRGIGVDQHNLEAISAESTTGL